MSDLTKLTIAEARDAMRKGDTTSAEITDACLTAIEGAGALGAVVHHTPEIAKDQAKAADARIAAGDAPKACQARPRAAFWKASSPNTDPPSRHSCLMQAQ